MSTTNESAAGMDKLAALDLRITLARKRLARVKIERDREVDRRLWRLLDDRGPDSIGDQLLNRLDALIKRAEDQVAQLEAERAAVLSANIDALFAEVER